MAAIKSSIKDILRPEKIPIILEKLYEMEPFVVGHHLTWKGGRLLLGID